MFVRRRNVFKSSLKNSYRSFLASSIKFMRPRAHKVQICTIFRGRTDRHLRGVLVIFEDRMTLHFFCALSQCV